MQLSIPKTISRKTGSFSIAEWCRHRRVSVSMYYKIKAEGWAPRTMSVGDRQFISAEADDSWAREREAAAAAGVRRAFPASDSPEAASAESR